MSDFRDKLRAEIIASQEERAGFVRQKFTYVIATFGLGTISSQSIPTSNLIFLAPIIAFAFDLYIAGVDYGIKRAGAFLGRPSSTTSSDELAWQNWVFQQRDPFSRVAGPFLSGVVLVGSLYLIISEASMTTSILGIPSMFLFGAWGLINAILIAGVAIYSHCMNHITYNRQGISNDTDSSPSNG